MNVVCGEEELREFRQQWTGEQMLRLLAESGGRMRVDWAVGVGKSTSIDQTIEAAVHAGHYDLILVLLPTRRVIDERAWIRKRPRGVLIANLRPRPKTRCGPELDKMWQVFETRELAALGRKKLCGECPRRRGCFWPKQYTKKRLQNVRVIFATQAHLERSATFITHVKMWTEAGKVLVLLDEVNFVMKPFRRTVTRAHLRCFLDILRQMEAAGRRGYRGWAYLVELLLCAPTADLRHPEWHMPDLRPSWALSVQEAGWKRFNESFRFLGYDLVQFAYSPLESRERAACGDLAFAAPPYLNTDFVIYSGTATAEFSRFRLGVDFKSPFEGYRFQHPGTGWFNIASSMGTKTYFAKNAKQVLDFFAGLIAQRLREKRRPLLIAKKCFVPLCAKGIEERLRALGFERIQVVTRDWKKVGPNDPTVIPLINYGMIGTNLFEYFDCAYCLTGYYVTEDVVNTILQDVLASDAEIPIQITTGGRPRRRSAGVRNRSDRFYDVHRLAPLALAQQETDVVLQATGRVRPYTRPREVITFQCAAHPLMPYTREFHSLGEARSHFGVPSERALKKEMTRAAVESLRRGGQTQLEAATAAGLSIRTVRRYWR